MLTFVSKEYWLDVDCLHGPPPAPAHLVSALATPGILHGLVHTQEQASGLRGRGDGVGLDDSRLPDTSLKVVSNILVEDIYSVPGAVTSVLLSQLIQDVGGIEPSVVTQLAGDDLEGLGHGANDELLLARHSPRVIAEVFAQLHVDSAAPGHDGVILHGPPDNHDRVMETPLCLLHELLCSSSQDDGARSRLGAAVEIVESLASNLFLLERLARSKSVIAQVMDCGLYSCSAGILGSVEF